MESFRLLHPAGTRATWWAVGALCAVASAATVWAAVVTTGALVGVAVALGLSALYAWTADAAIRMARSRRRVLEVHEDRLVVTHDGMLGSPIAAPRSAIEAITIDDRLAADRAVAASVRRGAIAPSFLNPTLPVVSVAPSSHSRYGAAVTPNVAVLFSQPVPAPSVPRAIRLLIRIGTGKSGRYCGPRPGTSMEGLRLAVEDPDALARAVTSWNVLGTLPRDERYLAPIRAADRARARRGRLITVGIVAGVIVLILVQQALRP